MTITLITGGARSGKSRRAEELVRAMPGQPVYIATAQALDAEMTDRVKAHRTQRGPGWITHEEPRDLVRVLNATDGQGPRLVDCLTLWLSNTLLDGADWLTAAQGLAEALPAQRTPVVLVSNEVGMGIVPDNALAREFRDAQGRLNQMIAQAATRVEFVVAGLPIVVKG